MKTIKFGVFGLGRGDDFVGNMRKNGAELVAICDKWEEGLNKQKEYNKGLDIAYYDNFDDFLKTF